LVESGNIKLGQVATDALGVSGLQMLRALAAGETNPEKMSSMARGRMKRKQGELKRALSGQLTEAYCVSCWTSTSTLKKPLPKSSRRSERRSQQRRTLFLQRQ